MKKDVFKITKDLIGDDNLLEKLYDKIDNINDVKKYLGFLVAIVLIQPKFRLKVAKRDRLYKIGKIWESF